MLSEIKIGCTYRNVFDREKVEVLDIFKSKDMKPNNMIKYKKQNPVVWNDRKGTTRKLDIFTKSERVFEQTYMI